ncbi:MAG: phosphoheptose isomerase [Candidatus Paceibacterota bacterium]
MDLYQTTNQDGTTGSPLLPDGVKNYLIDIDGTICEDIPNEEPERMKTASEISGAKEIINKWYEDGHIITFFTSRLPEHKEYTENWLTEHGFRYHGVLYGKPRGGNYHWIDDRKVRATQFKGQFTELVPEQKEVLIFKES